MTRSGIKLAMTCLVSLSGLVAAQPGSASSTEMLEELCEHGWVSKLPNRYSELLAVLGEAQIANTLVEPNPHLPQDELEWRDLKFDRGLRVFVVLVNRDPDHMFVSYAAITSPRRDLPGGLHVGDTSAKFISVLGTPNTDEAGRLSWFCNDKGADSITAVVDSGIVKELRWFYYVD